MPLLAIQPGATALTRTPACAHSKAAVIVRLLMPARAAPLWPMPGMPLRKSAVMLTTAPPCACMHWLKSSRIIRKPPVRLLATTASKPFLLMAISGAGNCPPALLTRPCTAPCCASTAATHSALTASSSRMSKATVWHMPPSALISSATTSSLAWVRPLMSTVAPSAASSCATQRPMPLPPPVTMPAHSRKPPVAPPCNAGNAGLPMSFASNGMQAVNWSPLMSRRTPRKHA
jgi:hypothetical protein